MLTLVASALLYGCAAAGTSSPNGAGQLDDGTRLLAAKCSACHLKPTPGERSTEAWDQVLTQHEEFLLLKPEDREVLLRLLSR